MAKCRLLMFLVKLQISTLKWITTSRYNNFIYYTLLGKICFMTKFNGTSMGLTDQISTK